MISKSLKACFILFVFVSNFESSQLVNIVSRVGTLLFRGSQPLGLKLKYEIVHISVHSIMGIMKLIFNIFYFFFFQACSSQLPRWCRCCCRCGCRKIPADNPTTGISCGRASQPRRPNYRPKQFTSCARASVSWIPGSTCAPISWWPSRSNTLPFAH